jgi:TPR repeat protein
MTSFFKSCLVASAIALLAFTTKASHADEATVVSACDAGSVARCEDLVRFYGEGATENRVKWAAYAEKACSLNSAGVCNNLGVAWSTGRIGTGRPDFARGVAYYRKACELSHGLGCFNFANMHRLGEGVAVEPRLAFENFSKACELNEAKGCTELGIMYHDGKVVPKNVLMTLTLFQKGCKLGSAMACKNADILLPRVQ